MSNNEIFCYKKTTGTCRPCNVLLIAIRNARWKSLNLAEAKRKVGQEYCPSGELPQLELVVNNEASFGMGQSRSENTDWSEPD